MESNDLLVVLAMVIYFVVVLAVGFSYAKRSNSSTDEYFIGGRKVGPWFTALSAEASDMSGYLLMGIPGLAYFFGASEAMWTCIGLAIGTYLNWLFVAKRLRQYSERVHAITIPAFFSNRFHDKKNILSTVAAVIILLFFCVYTGSCFVTCGKLFHTLFGIDYAAMMIFGAVVVFAYTLVGGYLSVVATDFIQGCLMFFALAVVLIGSIASVGGVDVTVAFLQNIPGFLSGTDVRDKDGVNAVMLIAEAACYYKKMDMTLVDAIEELYKEFGTFGERTVSIVLPGKDGVEKMQKIMQTLRAEGVEKVGPSRVMSTRDYMMSEPKSDVLYYTLEQGWACVRQQRFEAVDIRAAVLAGDGAGWTLPTVLREDAAAKQAIGDVVFGEYGGFTSRCAEKALPAGSYELCIAYRCNGHDTLVRTGIFVEVGP